VARARYRRPWVTVGTLAVVQVFSWGSLYYTLSLFVVPMQTSLGWSRPLLNGALWFGLLAMGAAAFAVGAWINRHGGRTVMTLGSLLGVLLQARGTRRIAGALIRAVTCSPSCNVNSS
jgi:hypothetical protein